jgi:hypothetical protein
MQNVRNSRQSADAAQQKVNVFDAIECDDFFQQAAFIALPAVKT